MSKIIRVDKKDNFVVLDKAFLNNKELSWKAKGILAFMLSKPNDWTFYIEELIKHSTDGERSFRAGFKELTEKGHVVRKPVRKGQRIERWETIVYETSQHCRSVHVENVEVQNVDVQKQHVQNEALLSTDITKNDITKNNLTNKESPSISKVREIYNHYLSKGIIQHKNITSPMRSSINARLKDYTYEQLIQAIDNYSIVYNSEDYWFDTKYNLADLMRDKDVRKFIDDAEPLNNFKEKENNFNRGKGFVPMEHKYDPNKDAF